MEQRQLLNSTITLTALGTHFVSLFIISMSQEDGKVNLNDSETLGLVDFLWEHRAEAGDGGTFKEVVLGQLRQQLS